MERRAEELKNGAREGTGNRRNKRFESRGQQLRLLTRERMGKKRCSRGEPDTARRGRFSANLSTESNVRDVDGRSRDRRTLPASLESGQTQSWCAGHRSNEHGAIRTTSGSQLADTQRQTSEGNLCPHSCEAGRNSEAERGNADTRDTNGTGPVHPAVAAASADTDLRSEFQ